MSHVPVYRVGAGRGRISAEGSRDPLVLKPGAEVGLYLECSRNTKKGTEARLECVEGDPRSPRRPTSSSAVLRIWFCQGGVGGVQGDSNGAMLSPSFGCHANTSAFGIICTAFSKGLPGPAVPKAECVGSRSGSGRPVARPVC